MNLSLAISFLLTTSAASYVTNVLSSNKGVPGKLSANALGYSISESETELSTAPTQEDLDFEALARLLGYQDNVIRSHYAAWCARYEKKPDETRYCNFKKNFLLQEDYNRQTRQTFDLNMYGDMTEEEYFKMKEEAMAAVIIQEHDSVDNPYFIQEDIVENSHFLEQPVVETTVEILQDPEQFTPENFWNDGFGIVEEPASEEEEFMDEQGKNIDESNKFVAKYQSIDSVEERAYEVLKDMDMLKPAPQHFSVSYLHEVPALKVEPGQRYLDALGNPEISALPGFASVTSYQNSIPSSANTFEHGKEGQTLGAATSYLDDICQLIEPFLDCNKPGKVKSQPRPPTEEQALQSKYKAITNLGDRAFQILVDLCMVGSCSKD